MYVNNRNNSYETFIASLILNSSNEEAIISLLKARGFLIDSVQDKYCLSDNSYPPVCQLQKSYKTSDLEYLKSILRETEIGFVDNQERIRLEKTDDITVQHFAEYLFPREPVDPIYPEEMCFKDYSWKYLRSNHYGEKVAVCCLEPYIARYVKAISSCGLSTKSSCDGFHKNSHALFILFFCKPYELWHVHLWKHYLSKLFKLEWNRTYSRISLKNNRFLTYSNINRAAEFLYDNRIELRQTLNNSVQYITESLTKHYSTEDTLYMVIERAKADLDRIFLN